MASASVSIPGSSFSPDIPRKLTITPTFQAGNLIDFFISFRFSHMSMLSDTIEVTLPSDFTISTNTGDYTISGSNTLSTPFITFNSTQNSFSFNPFNLDKISRASLTITIRNIQRPRECKTTGNFTIKSLRNGQYISDSASCCPIQL